MPNSKNKKSINLDKKVLQNFEYLYPRCEKEFLERSLVLATSDRSFFEKVFFNPVFVEVL